MEGILQQFYPKLYGIMFPYLLWGIQYLSGTACIFMIVTIAIQRYYAVHYPQNYRSKDPKRVVQCLACVSILAFAMTISKFFEARPQGEILTEEDQLGCNFRASFAIKVKDTVMMTELGKSGAGYWFFNAIIFQLLITGIIPFITLIVLYSKIYQRIRATQANVKDFARSKTFQVTKHKMDKEAALAKIFAGFVITFLISRIPTVLIYFTTALPKHQSIHSDQITPLPLSSKIVIVSLNPLLKSINASTNVLIYAGLSKKFREECKRHFQNIKSRYFAQLPDPTVTTITQTTRTRF